MFRYIRTRVTYFIPTLFLITLFGFLLITKSSKDPVTQLLTKVSDNGSLIDGSNLSLKKDLARKYHFDRPLFYFELNRLSSIDTLERVLNIAERDFLECLTETTGNVDLSLSIYEELKKSNHSFIYVSSLSTSAIEQLPISKVTVKKLKGNESAWKSYLPGLSWNGLDCRYHHWLVGMLSGDFGISFQDGRPVSSAIWDRLFYTLLFSGISLFISYFVSIYLALFVSSTSNKRLSSITTVLLFFIHSLPVFWLAALMLSWVSSYSINIPTFGLHEWQSDLSFWTNFSLSLEHMLLPLICWTYSSMAFIYFQFKSGIENQMNSNYVRTAFSKGLLRKYVVKRHVSKNALIPMITITSEVLPHLIGGSVIIEVIFAIPGMGKYMYDGIIHQDYPVVLTVLVFSSVLLILGYLIADILYTWADPRIKSQFLKND